MAHKIYDPRQPWPKGYDVEEYCPWCDKMIPIVMDEECMDDLEFYCPVCGKHNMICTMCSKPCDFNKDTGCCMRRKKEM